MGRAIKKIIFISPPAYAGEELSDLTPLPPMGMGYLAAAVREAGYQPQIIDSLGLGWNTRVPVREGVLRVGLSDEQIAQEIDRFKPDVIAISNLFSKQFGNALNVALIARQTAPAAFIVIGGAAPTADPDRVMSHGEFDALVVGEGETALVSLLDYLSGRAPSSRLEAVYLRESGKINQYPRRTWIEPDSLPLPAYDLMRLETYFGLSASHGARRHPRWLPIITSRGCPAKCTFCSAHKVWGRKFRARSVENVIAEMKFIKKNYLIKELMFEDDNTTLDTRRAKDLFEEMLRQRLDFSWDTPNGVAAFALDANLLSLMKAAGCYQVNLAIESGNQEHLLKNIRKPLKLHKVPALVRHCKSIGLGVSTFLVFGMPGETEEMVWDSARFVASLGLYRPHISIATPYPGTELFEICRSKGYLQEDFSYDDLHIRSYAISTPELPAERLRVVMDDVISWLRVQEFKSNPAKALMAQALATLRDPARVGRVIKSLSRALGRGNTGA
jgi:radical SAM superfamily enzyme YgiQ (UPF0313 family)